MPTRHSLRRTLPLTLLLVVLALCLAGCGGTSPSGTVVARAYSPAHYDPCRDWAKVCFDGTVGDRWYLELQDDSSAGDSWVQVSQAAYDDYKLGQSYP